MRGSLLARELVPCTEEGSQFPPEVPLRGPEALKPLRQKLGIGFCRGLSGKLKALSSHPLNTVLEHGAINFMQDVLTNMDPSVRINSYDVRVIGGMMDFAQT